ncbi:MAG: 16S rRNA (cytidine(1402)-2'-O)-methyltransferase [Deltaproteobacteria bacterium]|nr:16S rRNA (cytidine(1402)-2'-O)-methyltransferase [Deltaproteobacteria bacterium]
MTGTLYVVATPIGNLEDITLRALRILKEADLIAAEDTRRTRKLCAHYDIHTQLISYALHNEASRTDELIAAVQRGKNVALVTDAGTPGIADPGYLVVRAAREAGLPVVPVPGACAFIAALSAAGIPSTRFSFVGFLPEKSGRRRALMESLAQLQQTQIFYVAKWDLSRILKEMVAIFGVRDAMITRELTKVHEEFRAGTLEQLAGWAERESPQGEFTLIVAPS